MEQSERDILAKERTLLAGERTLMAAERTFSAWIRTGLAGMGGGVAIVRLISFESFIHKIIANFAGGFLIVWGIGVFLFALLRYKRSINQLEKATGHTVPIWSTTVIISGLVIVSLLLLFIVI